MAGGMSLNPTMPLSVAEVGVLKIELRQSLRAWPNRRQRSQPFRTEVID